MIALSAVAGQVHRHQQTAGEAATVPEGRVMISGERHPMPRWQVGVDVLAASPARE
ncbi:hypothetical protein [Microbacterium oxydans]|uniref:hypothetical protein n=1 Tax=Microbacterium oxydans TaxID=82380 RepID=UPI003671BEEA